MGSQFNEDEILERLLPGGSGSYVDVGAYHPFEMSNTWGLYCRGWSGLLIEPLAECWELLETDRPRDTLIRKAASNRSSVAKLRVGGACSTLEENWPIESEELRPIETDTLANILKEFPSIASQCALCNIDVEGHENQVLNGIDFDVFSPELFLIESRRHGSWEQTHQEWEPILLEQGYRFIEATNDPLQFNRFYRKIRQ